MNKTKRYLIIVAIMIVTLLLSVNWATPAQANKAGLSTPQATEMNLAQPDGSSGVPASKKQQKDIKKVIQYSEEMNKCIESAMKKLQFF